MDRLKVLVVDDEVGMREVLQDDLEMAGFSVVTAESGNKALKILSGDETFGLVISDVRMPDGDGYYLVREIRKIHPHLPFVALITGYTDVPEDEAKRLGAKAMLTKPYEYDLLIKIVSSIINEADEFSNQSKPQK